MAAASRRDDTGVAAMEFILVAGVLFGLLAFVVPLAVAMYQKVQLERAAGQVARFATEQVGPTEAPAPDARDVQTEATNVYGGPGSVTADPVSVASDSGCARGNRVTVTLHSSAALGPFSFVYALIGQSPTSSLPLTATASSCQE